MARRPPTPTAARSASRWQARNKLSPGTRRGSRTAARRSRTRLAFARVAPAQCILLTFVIPTATNCARIIECRLPELSRVTTQGPPVPAVLRACRARPVRWAGHRGAASEFCITAGGLAGFSRQGHARTHCHAGAWPRHLRLAMPDQKRGWPAFAGHDGEGRADSSQSENALMLVNFTAQTGVVRAQS